MISPKERIRWLQDHRVWGHPIEPQTELVIENWQKYQALFDDNDPNEPMPTVRDFHQDYQECIDIDFTFVHPETETIDDDEEKNTSFRVWLEAGPPYDMSQDRNVPVPLEGWTDDNRWIGSVDNRLCVGAATLEAALLLLADRVEQFYNEDGTEKS